MNRKFQNHIAPFNCVAKNTVSVSKVLIKFKRETSNMHCFLSRFFDLWIREHQDIWEEVINESPGGK